MQEVPDAVVAHGARAKQVRSTRDPENPAPGWAQLDPGDVIAEVESLVAQIIDPEHHPLYGVVAYDLEAGSPDTGRRPWNLEALAAAYDRLVQEALRRLIDEKLGDFGRRNQLLGPRDGLLWPKTKPRQNFLSAGGELTRP